MTGSGTTVDALIREASHFWDQAAVFALPEKADIPSCGGLPDARKHPLFFESAALPYPIPGMSDVMPYQSAVFSQLTRTQLDMYRTQWHDHLIRVLDTFQPDVIHSHHLWILSSLLKDIAPHIPVVTHCHGTGLRQLTLCPHLSEEVIAGCRKNDAFVVLHEVHRTQICSQFAVPKAAVHVVGAGYRDDVFTFRKENPTSQRTLSYAGKLSYAKGVPWLLDAIEIIHRSGEDVHLHIAGAGSGEEGNTLLKRINAMSHLVTYHGVLPPEALAAVLQRSHVFVLPSFYEGLPLVLAEASACGNRLVTTRLPGIVDQLEPVLAPWMSTVPLPDLKNVDQPTPTSAQRFTNDLVQALMRTFELSPLSPSCESHAAAVRSFKWQSVYEKTDHVWRSISGI